MRDSYVAPRGGYYLGALHRPPSASMRLGVLCWFGFPDTGFRVVWSPQALADHLARCNAPRPVPMPPAQAAMLAQLNKKAKHCDEMQRRLDIAKARYKKVLDAYNKKYPNAGEPK